MQMLPWDWDIDTQVSGSTLLYMGEHHNQTMYNYTAVDDPDSKRTYLLDVNPACYERERGNGNNIIDARWIDVRNGLYIDITGLSETHPDDSPGVWSCKNYHRYHTTDLYPMRETLYEGVVAKVPYAYDRILTQEYNEKALVLTDYEGCVLLQSTSFPATNRIIATGGILMSKNGSRNPTKRFPRRKKRKRPRRRQRKRRRSAKRPKRKREKKRRRMTTRGKIRKTRGIYRSRRDMLSSRRKPQALRIYGEREISTICFRSPIHSHLPPFLDLRPASNSQPLALLNFTSSHLRTSYPCPAF